MDTIDYSQPSTKILFDLINRKNGTNLRVQDFVISEPAVNINTATQTDTSVILTPIAGSGYYGTREVKYKRMDVDSVFGLMAMPTQPTTETTLYEYLSQINAFYGIHLKEEDIYDAPIPAYDPEHPTAARTVTLVVKPTSYFFTGSYEFIFGISNNAIQENDGVTRVYYAWIDGLPIDQVKDSVIALNVDASDNTSFNFLSNVYEITAWTLDRITMLSNNSFALDGSFTLRQNQPDTVSTYGGLIVDQYGALVTAAVDKIFNLPANVEITRHAGVNKYYAIDPANTSHDSHLFAFNEDGTPVAGFNPAISYEPKFIRLAPNGRIYTVSAVYQGGDPLNNNLLTELIRIDRLMPNGSFDPSFDTIYIRSSDPLIMPVPVMDICPIDTGGFYLAFAPARTTDINIACPVINGQTLLAIDITAGATYSWNPVVRFEADGGLDLSFKTMLPGLRSTAVYEPNGSPLTWGSKALISEGEKTFWMTYRRNPVTGYEHRQPFQYDLTGKEVLLNGLGYKDQYKWTQLLNLFSQSNGLFVGYGMMQSYQLTGTLSVPYSAIGRYKQTGEIDRLLWRSPGPVGNSNPTVKAVFLKETV